MKIYHVAVIYEDQEIEGYAVLAEDGKRAREVLADHLSRKRSYQYLQTRGTVQGLFDGRARTLEDGRAEYVALMSPSAARETAWYTAPFGQPRRQLWSQSPRASAPTR